MILTYFSRWLGLELMPGLVRYWVIFVHFLACSSNNCTFVSLFFRFFRPFIGFLITFFKLGVESLTLCKSIFWLGFGLGLGTFTLLLGLISLPISLSLSLLC